MSSHNLRAGQGFEHFKLAFVEIEPAVSTGSENKRFHTEKQRMHN